MAGKSTLKNYQANILERLEEAKKVGSAAPAGYLGVVIAGKHVLVNLVHSTSEVAIVVQDQGLGMTAEQLEKVMSNGGRVVDATLGIDGSGFGLDSTRRVLTAHGGRLEAKSTPGQGSTFVAFLPII